MVLEDAPFENVLLNEYTRDRTISIDGKQTDKDRWEFIVPDSIVADSNRMRLRVANYDSASNSVSSIGFVSQVGDNEIQISNTAADDEVTYIYAAFNI